MGGTTGTTDRSIRLGTRQIADGSSCYVIAEVGHNHQGDVEQCKQMFAAAKESGASAVKLQKRDNRGLYTAKFFDKPYENDNSFGRTYGEHREALEFDRDQYAELKAYCAEIEIDFFATAFDLESLAFLEDLDMPSYKVASADVRHHPLLEALAATGKPVILSTGGADLSAVRQAYEILRAGTPDIAILQCTAGYPAAWEELDLRVIETYRREFPDVQVGLSSHDNGIAMATAAYVLGARVIEKHFTLDRTMRGTDHKFSLEPVGMRKMVRDLERVRLALGDGAKRVYESEKAPIQKMSKSLVAARELPAGHVLTVEDIAFKSPGDGLAPSEIEALVGTTLLTGVRADTLLTLELVELGDVEAQVNGNGKPAGKSKRRAADGRSRVLAGR